MKSKKVTMLAAALVVAVVALAGIGYAVQYTAETSNTQNSISTTYLTLEQGNDTGAYTGNFFDKAYFNSVNTAANVTTYSPVYDYNLDGDTLSTGTSTATTATNLSKISNPLSLIVKPTNNTQTSVKLDVTVTDFTPVTGLIYKMVIVDSASKAVAYDYTASKWTFTLTISATDNTTFNVYLFICGSASNSTGTEAEPAVPMSPTVGFTNYVDGGAAGSIFTFKVTADTTTQSNP